MSYWERQHGTEISPAPQTPRPLRRRPTFTKNKIPITEQFSETKEVKAEGVEPKEMLVTWGHYRRCEDWGNVLAQALGVDHLIYRERR